jgi:hypothetical protein
MKDCLLFVLSVWLSDIKWSLFVNVETTFIIRLNIACLSHLWCISFMVHVFRELISRLKPLTVSKSVFCPGFCVLTNLWFFWFDRQKCILTLYWTLKSFLWEYRIFWTTMYMVTVVWIITVWVIWLLAVVSLLKNNPTLTRSGRYVGVFVFRTVFSFLVG